MEPTTTPLPGDLVKAARRLSDEELIVRVRRLAADERRDGALLVAHLAELGDRELHLRAGYSSLFVYCRDALALSEHDSYNRIEAARAARRLPAVLERLASGAVNLTTLRLLAPHLTPENHERVLDSAAGKRRAEVEEIVARLAPLPEAPPFVRRLPEPRVAWRPATAPAVGAPGAAANAAATTAPPVAPGPVDAPGPAEATERPASPLAPYASVHARPASRADLVPLAPDRYRLQVTIGGATVEKLRLAQDMLRHVLPTGDEAAILDRALDALLAELARARFAATPGRSPSRPTAEGSRHVPAEVKRAVWLRDLARCAYVAADGRRCNERAFVEFHHVRPYAAGGEASAENIQLRCRRHNHYEARTFFAAARDEGAAPR